jgi:tetratricopeptide (TPR) repeat protein
MKNYRIALSSAIILIAGFIAFQPCLKNGFVNWDDDKYLTENIAVQNLSLPAVKNVFTSFFAGNYHPLTMMSYLIEFQAFKLEPFGYHLTGLILHLLNSLLVFWLIYMLARKIPVSVIVAVLFAVHPMHVESVAWISERKDLLYSLFFLSSVILYCYYLREGRKKFYYLSLGVFVLSLLSKAMAITLPVVLILVDYILYRKPDKNKRIFKEKAPFFILTLIFGALAVFSQFSADAVRNESLSGFASKIAVSCYGVGFYINKIFLPVKLSCFYPYFSIMKDGVLFLYPIITFVVMVFSVIWSGKYTRKVIFGSLFFLVTILPILQFIPIGGTFVSDRYTYLPAIGIFYILAEGWLWLYARETGYRRLLRVLLVSLFIIVAGALIILSRQRCLVWKDSVTLWSDVLNKYPDVTIAYNNRGAEFIARKEYAKAHEDLVRAITLDPSYDDAGFNLGDLYASQGNYDEAVKHFNKVLAIKPDDLGVYNRLAVICGLTGKHAEAINICKAAIKIKPDDFMAYVNLCSAYGSLGYFKEAVVCGEKAVALNPRSALGCINLSAAYFYSEKYDLAVKYCDKAIALGYKVNPKYLKELSVNKK